jgi:hypothetical protein
MDARDAATGGAVADGSGDDEAAASCMNDPRVDHYVPNLTKLGQSGALKFILLASDPAPPALGSNKFSLKIVRADGSAVTGEVKPDLSMPDHHHPITVRPAMSFDSATVTYTADPVYLFMPGVWRVQFASYDGAADAGAPLDTGVFFFCVDMP